MRAPHELLLRIGAASEAGRSRAENQDAFLVARIDEHGPPALGTMERTDGGTGPVELSTRPPGVLLLVADGMGGAAAGEVASGLAATAVREAVQEALPERADATSRSVALKTGILEADERIQSWAERHEEYRGMGCTITALLLAGVELHVAHVGDSRGYLLRQGTASRLTRDQTVAQELVETGAMSPEEADVSDRRHVLLHAVGTERSVSVHLNRGRCRPGDALLLCSDGLTDLVSDQELADRLSDDADPDGVCRELVNLANDRGGPDNITVVAARAAAPSPEG